jgi:iron complex transport system substrate-binding protein
MGTTELEQKPENVVVLFNGMVDISLALGVQPVGAVESWVQQPWYEYLRDDMDGVVNLGLETQPDLEQIVELDPDLIIGVKVRHEEIYEQLADIAPTVMAAEVHTWKDNMELAGEALYAEEEANAFFAEWDARVADFQEQMGDKLDMEVSFINFRADHSRIYAAGYTGLIFEELGFSRPENQRVDDAVIELTSKESIPEMDGDVIFEFTYDTGEDGAVFETQQDWKSHPLWETLNAVQQDQVYEVDEVAWNTAGGAQSAMMLLDDLYELFELEQ